LREGLAKDKGGTLEERVGRIEERYNNTYHTTIKCMPNEAWDDNNEIVSMENEPKGVAIRIDSRRGTKGGSWREA
jgi:hypothetical protein